MCHFCEAGHDLEDAKTQVAAHGYQFLQPNAPLQYGVAWDGRIVAQTEKRERAVTMAAEQNAGNPGSWEPRQRRVGPWEPLS